MARTYVSVEIGLPAAMCYTYVKGSVNHPKFLAAYRSLNSGRGVIPGLLRHLGYYGMNRKM